MSETPRLHDSLSYLRDSVAAIEQSVTEQQLSRLHQSIQARRSAPNPASTMDDLDADPDMFSDNLEAFGKVMSHFYRSSAGRSIIQERRLDAALDKQLHNDLSLYLNHHARPLPTGISNSLLYTNLPAEIRHEIYSYIVSAPQSIHVFPPKGNERHGFRLSLCEESTMDFNHGTCNCDNGRTFYYSVQSEYLDSALFLVSRTVRREALDVLFMRNRFTFTSLYELVRFTTQFQTSASKIQYLRLIERVDDYPVPEHRCNSIAKARAVLNTLRSLTLLIYISDWSAYETKYIDGYINEIIHLHPTTKVNYPGKVEIQVMPRGRHNRTPQNLELAEEVRKKLEAVFAGEFGEGTQGVPRGEMPKLKVREDERPLVCRKGILALGD